MWITSGRVFYRGLLGEPTLRRLGGHVLYLCDDDTLHLSVGDGPWQSGVAGAVAPYRPHRIRSAGARIIVFILEPETVPAGSLPLLFREGCIGAGDHCDDLSQLREAVRGLEAVQAKPPSNDRRFDEFFFGGPLPSRPLDPRIRQALDALDRPAQGTAEAVGLAAEVGLSASRFVHLFKQETGVPLRALRAWKRARALLRHVTVQANLADLAQEIGYADSAHFSHSIRQTFGLRPKAVMAGSRRLVLFVDDEPPLRKR